MKYSFVYLKFPVNIFKSDLPELKKTQYCTLVPFTLSLIYRNEKNKLPDSVFKNPDPSFLYDQTGERVSGQ